MTIAPVRHAVHVKAPPARAFDLFTTHIGLWWPAGRTPAQNPHVAVVIEPHANGRWFERDADGNETEWGKVLTWEPPSRLILGWQLNWRPGHMCEYDPDLVTEVELRFEPGPTGGTLVTLEHRNLERFATDAPARARAIDGGWSARLNEFEAYVTSLP